MSKIEKRLVELGFQLPEVPKPIANYEIGDIQGDLLFLSGQGPLLENGNLARGLVGDTVTLEEAYLHAQRTGLALISAMKELLGDLDRVRRVVKLLGMVNAVKDFKDHPKVINGCSDLFCDVFGDAGRHARSAVGMGSLPGGITVEIETIVAINN